MTAVSAPIECCAPLSSPAITDEEAVATAEIFRALSDPNRVKIVNQLATAGEAVCACEIVPALGLAQPTVSHHLKTLTDAGLITREQRGKWAFFSLAPEALRTLAAMVDPKGA